MVTKHFGFNPRICKRCDKVIGTFALGGSVSIHASVKDATDWLDPNNTGAQVSIHASVKDATFWAPVLVAHLFCFNPRICKRCDFYRADGIPAINVSIHASVKDATQVYLIRSVTLSFNPRICKRCDLIPSPSFYLKCFNPRICKRCDTCVLTKDSFQTVSIHASVKDATLPELKYSSITVFQSTHL